MDNDKAPLMGAKSQIAQHLPEAAKAPLTEAKSQIAQHLPDAAKAPLTEAKSQIAQHLPDAAKAPLTEAKSQIAQHLPDAAKAPLTEAKSQIAQNLPDAAKAPLTEAKSQIAQHLPDAAKAPLTDAKSQIAQHLPEAAKAPLTDAKSQIAQHLPQAAAQTPRDITDIPKLKDQLAPVPPPQPLPLAAQQRAFPLPHQPQYPMMLQAPQQGPPPQMLPRPGVGIRRTREEPSEMRRARIKRVTISAFKEIAKTVLLIIAVTLYAVIGAFAFKALEQTNEKDTCTASENLYVKMENDTSSSLWKAANKFRTSENPDAQVMAIEQMIQNFSNNVRNLGYDGKDCGKLGDSDGPQYQWNFPGSLLFSVTVFTTVGYGNIAPKTDWGRMFCIAYAMVGLPLMFFTLANIGEHMAVIFRFVYVKVCCLGLCAKKRQPPPADRPVGGQPPQAWGNKTVVEDDDDDDDENEDEEEITIPLTLTLVVIAGYIGLGALIFAVWEGWDAMAAAYFTFVTVSTIGLGDLVPGISTTGSDAEGSLKLLTCAAYMLFGMALLSMGFDLIQYEMANKITSIGGQNVGRAGDTVNELQGKEDNELDPDVAMPTRNIQPLPIRPNQTRPVYNDDMKGPDFNPPGSKMATSHI